MLEALIAILIVALGVLGIVGLYARSIQNVDDSKFRGEAALLVDQLVGQMWISDPKPASLVAKFDSGGAGAEYTEFAALVAQRLPNSIAPVVTVTAGPTPTSSNVAITIQWKHPGDANDPTPRKYDVNAVIGANQ
jgi:type IV pilus assembly protein PilV